MNGNDRSSTYLNNLRCWWKIVAEQGKVIEFQLTKADLEQRRRTGGDMCYDYLSVSRYSIFEIKVMFDVYIYFYRYTTDPKTYHHGCYPRVVWLQTSMWKRNLSIFILLSEKLMFILNQIIQKHTVDSLWSTGLLNVSNVVVLLYIVFF